MKLHTCQGEGCFTCKIKTVGVGAVPGGTRKTGAMVVKERKFAKDQDAYYNARKAGETPDSTTVEGVRKARIRQESHERGMKKLEQAGALDA